MMDLKSKKIGVFGLGVSGMATIEFLLAQGRDNLTVVNQGAPESWNLPKGCQYSCFSQIDPEAASELGNCDLIILSPGIPRQHAVLNLAVKEGRSIWSEIELAYHFFKKPIIAVTGTNGKTTTVTLLGELFNKFGLKTFVGGNIGVPFVKAIGSDYDLSLLELSSFQLESVESFKAHICAILNVFPNHGERYDNVNDYRLAKWEIARTQEKEDFLFVGEGVGSPLYDLESQLFTQAENWEAELSEVYDFKKAKLVGVHNRKNIWFAWKIFKTFLGSKYDQAAEDFFIKETCAFSGVEHRVEHCGQWLEYDVYNDAKSTNWEATYTAIKAVSEKELPIILIMGGQLRGHNDLPDSVGLDFIKTHTSKVFTIGESGRALGKYNELFDYRENLQQVKEALMKCHTKSILLFSPGFPSFDQFENYAHRGRSFKEIF